MKFNLDFIPDYTDVEDFGAAFQTRPGLFSALARLLGLKLDETPREMASFYAHKGCTRLAQSFYRRATAKREPLA